MIVLIVIGALFLLYLVWQWAELRLFRVTSYACAEAKVKQEIRIAVLADLHSFTYGKDNERLIEAVKGIEPDLILCPGDMIVTAKTRTYERTEKTLSALRQIAPLFCSYGNHESRAEENIPEFPAYRKRMEEKGIVFLDNAYAAETVRGTELQICGLTIPLENYKRGKVLPLPEHFIEDAFGPCPREKFVILMAHDPAYAKDYFSYGADLTLAGHNHGGLLCLPNGKSVISPRFHLFPKYGAGRFDENGKTLLISRGLGTHTYHVRIFNRAELLRVCLKPDGASD